MRAGIVGVIIPSMDNRPYLEPCLASLRATTEAEAPKVLVVNNGLPGSCDYASRYDAAVAEPGGNVGWAGGLALGVERTAAPLLLFLNDDTYFHPPSAGWLGTLAAHLEDRRVGAVGPASNFAAGAQNAFAPVPYTLVSAPFLIGFCLLITRATLRKVGGVDPSAHAWDDRDLSIRLKAAGYLLVVDRTVTVYHHGSITGQREMGGLWEPGGWYGPDTLASHRAALVAKHGEQAVARQETTAPEPYAPPRPGG